MNELLQINFGFWILQTIAMLLTALLIPRLTISGPFAALATVIVLALFNSKLWDVALFFQIPNNFSTHTLLVFVANGLAFWMIVKLLPGIEVEGVLPALAAPLVFTVTSSLLNLYGRDIPWDQVYAQIVQTVHSARDYLSATPTAAPTPK